MFVRFVSHWMGHEPGSIDDLEGSMARRLVSLGIAETPPVGALKVEVDKDFVEESDPFAAPAKKKRGRPPKAKVT
jgi:hypothetical protein